MTTILKRREYYKLVPNNIHSKSISNLTMKIDGVQQLGIIETREKEENLKPMKTNYSMYHQSSTLWSHNRLHVSLRWAHFEPKIKSLCNIWVINYSTLFLPFSSSICIILLFLCNTVSCPFEYLFSLSIKTFFLKVILFITCYGRCTKGNIHKHTLYKWN